MAYFIKTSFLTVLIFFSYALKARAAQDESQMSVWVNEAVVATNSYNYQNFMERQKAIAHYFSAEAWINYSKAFQESGIPQKVQQKHYTVSAVATLPPTIKPLAQNQWEATMPIIVLYTSPEQKQKQTLTITIHFQKAPEGQGIRGLHITSFLSKADTAACVCMPEVPKK